MRHWPGKISCLHPADLNRCSVGLFPSGGTRPAPVTLPAQDLKKAESDVDIYTIIFLALAVFIFLRLRNVLGQRTGHERPPYDRAARNVVQGAQDNNVVPMPAAIIDQAPLAPTADVTPPT